MPRVVRHLLLAAIAVACLPAAGALAQDMYDPAVLRTFHLSFDQPDWEQQLRDNWEADQQSGGETLIPADLTVDGVTYTDVGVRIRGYSSYFWLPPGSKKFSLKIRTDFVDPDQDVMGYSNFNLNNGFQDPTFTREVVFNNYVAQFVPNPRANHVVLTINGGNWGVYNNVQQPNKRMLRDYFADAGGLRGDCSNKQNGPGLAYNGEDAAGYQDYGFSDDGGFADPVGELIEVTRALSLEPLQTWENIDAVFAIDPAIWSVVLENALTDVDSYVNKGCDFMFYRDPADGRMHLFPRDNNESFKHPAWSITRNFQAGSKPVLSRLMSVPELRQRYMAHYRTILRDFNWEHFGPLFEAQRAVIEEAVLADPRKIYTYEQFDANFTGTVWLATVPAELLVGIREFVDQRAAHLNAQAELVTPGPRIVSVEASDATPALSDEVVITALVEPVGAPVASVELFYRPRPDQPYQRVGMVDDGTDPDADAGDGVHTVVLPLKPLRGQRVDWYVGATSANALASVSFLPELSERGPNTIVFESGDADGVRITEWMYAGASGEFIEFTNLSGQPVDMTGWSMDDGGATPGAFDLGAFGIVPPGESVIVTESPAQAFRTAWGLPAGAKIIGGLGAVTGNNLGRNDQIHLFNADGETEDQLSYGDEAIPGSIRTQNASGQPGCNAIGRNEVLAWVLSAVGDVRGSFESEAGDVGTPATFTRAHCELAVFADGFE